MRHSTHKFIEKIIGKVRLGKGMMFHNNGNPVCVLGHIAVHKHGIAAENYTENMIGDELGLNDVDLTALVMANDRGEQKNVKRPVLRALTNMCTTCSAK